MEFRVALLEEAHWLEVKPDASLTENTSPQWNEILPQSKPSFTSSDVATWDRYNLSGVAPFYVHYSTNFGGKSAFIPMKIYWSFFKIQ